LIEKIKKYTNYTYTCEEAKCVKVYFPLFKATVRFVNTNQPILEILNQEAFTINSIAIEIHPQAGGGHRMDSKIIDPFHGIDDIKNNIIRGTSESILVNQPIYLLKAIKYMAKYNFDIDTDTMNIIKRNSKKIPFDKNEVTLELFDILKYKKASKYFRLLDELYILERIFPEILSMKKIKNESTSETVWEHSLKTLEKVEMIIHSDGFFVEHIRRSFERNFKRSFSTGRTKEQMIKLCALFHDIGKPHTNNNSKDPKYRYYGHHVVGGKLMQSVCRRMHLSEDECKYSKRIVKEHMRAVNIFQENLCCLEKQYEVFHNLKHNIYDVFLLGLGDVYAKMGEDTLTLNNDIKMFVEELIDVYITKYQELSDINNIIDNYDVEGLYDLDDLTVLDLLDEAKREIFFGNLDYKKVEIIKYLARKIS